MSLIGENARATRVLSRFHLAGASVRFTPGDARTRLMIFLYNGKEYAAPTAVEIVRRMARDEQGCEVQGDAFRDYLCRSIAGLADRIHMRELGISHYLSEEKLAFNYLCLLDECDAGCLDVSSGEPKARIEARY